MIILKTNKAKKLNSFLFCFLQHLKIELKKNLEDETKSH